MSLLVICAAVLSFSLGTFAQTSDSTLNQAAATPLVVKDASALTALQQALLALGAGPNSPVLSIVATGTYTTFLSDGSTNSVPLSLETLGTQKFRRSH
jgi:hypothetical protein